MSRLPKSYFRRDFSPEFYPVKSRFRRRERGYFLLKKSALIFLAFSILLLAA